MKKFALALSALAAFTGSGIAADIAPRTYAKAAPPIASWTGCYVAGGGGYGLTNSENTIYNVVVTPPTPFAGTETAGGRGYFGTIGGGCDYQFALGSWNMVVGAFGDYDFADIKGTMNLDIFDAVGRETLRSQWAAGGRVGALVTSNLLTYFSAGYTGAHFNDVNFVNNNIVNGPIGVTNFFSIPSQSYKGYFLGSGYEYALGFLPGVFWKTEYRFSELDTRRTPILIGGGSTQSAIDSHKYIQTIRSELVYRFNWGSSQY